MNYDKLIRQRKMEEMFKAYDKQTKRNNQHGIARLLAMTVIALVLGIFLAFVTLAHAYDYGSYYGNDASYWSDPYGTSSAAQERRAERIGRYVYDGDVNTNTYLIEGTPGCGKRCGYMLYTPGGGYGDRYVDPR